MPTDQQKSKNTLIYVLEHKSRDAAAASWKAFVADPDWKKAYKASRTDGPLLAKAPESVYMSATDYSPNFKAGEQSKDAVYEHRIYRTNEGKLPGLDSRFRDNTIKLFDQHGLASVAYWHPTKKPDSTNTLIYILRHSSRDAAKTAWKAFGTIQPGEKSQKNLRKMEPFYVNAPSPSI